MPGCEVAKCGNFNRKTKGTEIRYFKFPKNSELAKQWIVACKRDDEINLKNGKLLFKFSINTNSTTYYKALCRI